MTPARLLIALAAIPALASCATMWRTPAPHEAFWQALSSHCGKAFAGRMVSDEAPDADMRGAAMVMHVRECSPAGIAVPFHVQRADGSWDRSRTWLITRVGTLDNPGRGLRLKHDHRHEDGTPDAMTLYGGDTAAPGTTSMQEFPVDAESIALFRAEGRTVSVTNVWRVEVTPTGSAQPRFAYQLLRQPPNARNFRVEFDLTRPIPTPPPPWGHD